MKKKSIKLNAVLNGFRTILNLLFPLITFPYVSRVLSVNEVGKYNFSQSIITYFMLIAALGIDKFAVREGTKYRDNKEKFNQFASEIFSINIVSTIISYSLLFIYLIFSSKTSSYATCILIFSLQIFFTTIGTEWLYSIFEEYAYITIRSIAFKILSVVLLFVFVRNEGDYLAYAGITAFASVGSNILNFINARKYYKIRLTFGYDWKKLLKPILVIFASNVAVQIYVSSDITMLGYLKNDYVVGIYSLSTKIYTIVKQVLGAVLMVTIPRFAFYVGKNLKNDYEVLLKKVTNTLIILGVPMIVGLVLLSKDAILIIASEKYLDSQIPLIILSTAILFSIFSTLFNQCVLLPYKREKVFLKSSIISALLNIGFNFILIPFIGEIGAAITVLLAEGTMAIMNYNGCKDLVSGCIFNDSFKKNLVTVTIGSVGIIVVCLLSMKFIPGLYLQTIVAITGSVFVYFSILLIFKNEIIMQNFKSMRAKL